MTRPGRFFSAPAPRARRRRQRLRSTGAAAPPTGVGCPATGVASPTTGVGCPATGVASPTTGVACPATGAASPTTGVVRPGAGHAPPRLQRSQLPHRRLPAAPRRRRREARDRVGRDHPVLHGSAGGRLPRQVGPAHRPHEGAHLRSGALQVGLRLPHPGARARRDFHHLTGDDGARRLQAPVPARPRRPPWNCEVHVRVDALGKLHDPDAMVSEIR